MLINVLVVLALLFALVGALRFAAAPPRPPWLAPALLGLAVWAIAFRLGVVGVLLGAAVAAALYFLPRMGRARPAAIDVDAARALLGVGPAATPTEIRAAHRARIVTAHPDRGGDAQTAARLNAARDVLLKAASRRAS